MSLERYTVLIVDDDEEIIDLLKDHFRKRNCEAIATDDPLTVVDKLQNFAVKLMLLDLKMQKLNGFEVLDKIRKAGVSLPPTIIITGHLPKYEGRLKDYGIDARDVVTKPFNFEAMEQCINVKLGSQIVASEVGSEYENVIYEKNRCRLGFVEDEEDVLEHFAEFFKERNYEVSCYNNGTKAFESLKKERVDILFVDIKLPGMQGDDLMEALGKLSNPPVMIPISADPMGDGMVDRLKAAGCKHFIAKPFDIVELIELAKTIALEKKLLG
jgi:DNA-binding response OmpR family regulator